MPNSNILSNIRGLLFDKDGTLFDFHASWRPVMQAAAAMAAGGDPALASRLLAVGGYDTDSGTFQADSIIAAGHSGELAGLWHGLGAVMGRDLLRQHLDLLFAREGPRNAVPVTDLPALFSRLTRCGMFLGLATNDGQDAAWAAVRRFGLEGMLHFVAGYDSGHGAKPGPGMALAFCRAVSLPPAQVAMIGDSDHDMTSARSANLGARIGVLSGASAKARLACSADIVLPDITGLLELLD
ncbi:HAD family hydrolase [Desulfonatronum sp. SC1]|uniref:HAD family hydrolase n=1 Tax=Desulfonatronum sp. SC1 TaxID=2109626 RepID=UPI000D310DCD|nr:HAD family hydrolase [Desulfonatronum sp. SC1]PTN38487.1 haloacid dehalogenase [Desulfonatronum sp. SC1]